MTTEGIRGLAIEWLKGLLGLKWVHEIPCMRYVYKCMRCGWEGDEMGERCPVCGAEICISRWLAEGLW